MAAAISIASIRTATMDAIDRYLSRFPSEREVGGPPLQGRFEAFDILPQQRIDERIERGATGLGARCETALTRRSVGRACC